MRYAISYVSTASTGNKAPDILDLLIKSTKHNNDFDITGVLLSSDTNFFQLIEGEEEAVKILYAHIEKDTRHHNLIKFVDQAVFHPAYDGFIYGVITDKTKYNGSKLKSYLHSIEVLDPVSQQAVKRVIEAILV